MKIEHGMLAVITGASSGIGEATARALAGKGCRVILLARDRGRLEAIAADLRSKGEQADVYPIDLADARAITSVATAILSSAGAPDILINNAGAGRWLPLQETSAEEAAQMLAVPYLAAFNLTREFLGPMLGRGQGAIVNVTSVASYLAWPGATAYTAARRAIEGFNAALRADVHESGLRVMLAVFGTVESPYWEHNPGSRERLPKPAAGMRALSPEEAATAILIGIRRGARVVVRPAIFRLLFLANALFPGQIESILCRR